MIFYFSATGNSRKVAEIIAAENGDRLIDIGAAVRQHRLQYEAATGEDIGFVTPCYFWGIPQIVYDFMNQVQLNGKGTDRYVYHVVTFGSANGGANSMVMSQLQKNFGLTISATFAIRMVDTWVPQYDCSDQEKNLALTQQAEKEAADVARAVARHEAGEHNFYRGAWALLWPVAQLVYEVKRRTKYFSVTEDCTGCGLCEAQCPLHVIRLKDGIRLNNGRPVWTAEKCTLCLGCLHRCPAHAIRYGTKQKTVDHGQWVLRD